MKQNLFSLISLLAITSFAVACHSSDLVTISVQRATDAADGKIRTDAVEQKKKSDSVKVKLQKKGVSKDKDVKNLIKTICLMKKLPLQWREAILIYLQEVEIKEKIASSSIRSVRYGDFIDHYIVPQGYAAAISGNGKYGIAFLSEGKDYPFITDPSGKVVDIKAFCYLWDQKTGKIMKRFSSSVAQEAYDIALSETGDVGLFTFKNHAEIVDLPDGVRRYVLPSSDQDVHLLNSTKISKGGDRCFAAYTNGIVRIWNIQTRHKTQLYLAEHQHGTPLLISNECTRVIACPDEAAGIIDIWDVPHTEKDLTIPRSQTLHLNRALDVCRISGNGKYLVAITKPLVERQGTITIIKPRIILIVDLNSGSLVQEEVFRFHGEEIESISVSENGKRCVLSVKSSEKTWLFKKTCGFFKSILFCDLALRRGVWLRNGEEDSTYCIKNEKNSIGRIRLSDDGKNGVYFNEAGDVIPFGYQEGLFQQKLQEKPSSCVIQ